MELKVRGTSNSKFSIGIYTQSKKYILCYGVNYSTVFNSPINWTKFVFNFNSINLLTTDLITHLIIGVKKTDGMNATVQWDQIKINKISINSAYLRYYEVFTMLLFSQINFNVVSDYELTSLKSN